MFHSRLLLKDELWFRLASDEIKTLIFVRKEMEEKRQSEGRGKRTNPLFISCFKMVVFQNFT